MENQYEKYCHNCGAIIDKRTDLCPKCGARQANFQNAQTNVNINVNQRWLITVLLCGFWCTSFLHKSYPFRYFTVNHLWGFGYLVDNRFNPYYHRSV